MAENSEIRKYLKSRVTRDDYRGIHLAQHNRLPEEKLTAILGAIYEACGNEIFEIPPGDDPKPSRAHDPNKRRQLKGFQKYFEILDNIASSEVRGVSATFNSLKKNHFPNFDGMGLLSRTEDGRFGRLTSDGVKIVNSGPSRERTLLIGQAVERLIGAQFVSDLHSILRETDQLNVYEIMLFVSDHNLDNSRRKDLVRAYRRMRAVQRLQLHEEIFDFCQSTMNMAKKEMRDWHNWWNESKQIVGMLGFVPGFVVVENEHVMLVGGRGIPAFERIRSAQVKREALEWHGLVNKPGWELHHIYPIEYATSARDLALLDAKENLILIPRELHRQIPNRGNRSVHLEFSTTHITLSNPASKDRQPQFQFKISKDVLVDPSRLERMAAYNAKLLESVG